MSSSDLPPSKWVICRICLKDSTASMVKIFNDPELVNMIEKYGELKLSTSINLPDSICKKCLTLLKAATKFREKVQNSQAELNEKFQQQTLSLENFQITDACEEFIPLQKLADEEGINTTQNKATNTEFVLPEVVSYSVEYQDTQPDDVQDDAVADDVPYEDLRHDDKLIDYVDQDMEELELVLNVEGQQDASTFKIVPQFSAAIANRETPTKQRKRKGIDDGNSETQTHICPYCGNNYPEKAKLSLHMKIHTKEKPHQCEICFKRFGQTPQLARHMNSHTGCRPFVCRYCPSSFADPSTRIKHERIHTNVRPYECSVCQKAFAYSNVLKVHMMTHTGEKPYSCKYCGKQFSQAHHKKKHEQLHENTNSKSMTAD